MENTTIHLKKKKETYTIKEYGLSKALKDISYNVFEDLVKAYGVDEAKAIYTMYNRRWEIEHYTVVGFMGD